MNKKRSKVVVTSYGRNKNLDEKKQEKAKNSPSYRCAAIIKCCDFDNHLEKLAKTAWQNI